MAGATMGPGDDTLSQALSTIAQAIAASLELKTVFSRVGEACQALIPFDGMGLSLLERGGRVRVHAVAGDQSSLEREDLNVARADYSPRLWPNTSNFLVNVKDAERELDPSFYMDRDLVGRGYRSMLRVPLLSDGVPLGSLIFNSRQPAAYTEDHAQAVSLVAELLALAVSHEEMARGLRERRKRREALEKLVPMIAGTLDVRAVFEQVSRIAQEVVPHDYTSFALHSEDGQQTRLYTKEGADGVVREMPRLPVPEEIRHTTNWDFVIFREITVLGPNEVRIEIVNRHPLPPLVANLRLDDAWMPFYTDMGVRSSLRATIRLNGVAVGGLAFSSRQPDRFDDNHGEFAMRVAEHIALVLAHHKLAEESRRTAAAQDRAALLEERVHMLARELETLSPHRALGRSREWKDVLAQATKVAATDTTVLLTGESGTGKEVVARFIHRGSPRKDGPFVALNCAALPEHLLESELFGHEKGAFTGALTARPGRIEQAAGGVLFLDEVGEMTPAVQAKFLRVLQEREYQRLGGTRTLKADVRVLAATNRNLKAAISQGGFREDLYYRLAVFDIALPPLRDRPEDVALLVESFLEEIGRSVGRPAAGISQEVKETLVAYPWPGNVRELRNAIERAVILCEGGLITSDHLPVGVTSVSKPAARAASPAPPSSGPVTLDSVEREMIVDALSRAGNNKSEAARLLGLTRAQLYSRLDKHGLGER
jgi:transcriptional regulator with GAF, ATPase, and Fis domain